MERTETVRGTEGAAPIQDEPPRPPPKGAQPLLDDALSHWCGPGETAPAWRVERDELVVVPGAGDLVSRRDFHDFQLHLEFWLPPGQRSNSGVYLQGRYELQLLDSAGEALTDRSCGAIYGQRAPALDASRPAGVWQSLDVAFRSPVLDTNGFPAQPARVTASLNDLLIHDNVNLTGSTAGACDTYLARSGPLVLQDHGAPVRFRNVWLVEEPRC